MNPLLLLSMGPVLPQGAEFMIIIFVILAVKGILAILFVAFKNKSQDFQSVPTYIPNGNPSPTITGELDALKRQLDQKIITQDEFDLLKKNLLDKTVKS